MGKPRSFQKGSGNTMTPRRAVEYLLEPLGDDEKKAVSSDEEQIRDIAKNACKLSGWKQKSVNRRKMARMVRDALKSAGKQRYLNKPRILSSWGS